LESVASILENPTLAPLFGPESRAEVPLAGVVADVEIGGLVDRLAVTDQTIFVADYKTDRAPPTAPEAIPAAYLSQLAAYSAILGDIFPGRAILCTLIWTETATPMAVPPAMLAAHAPQPVQPYAA
jgi:ATP-dependent helicase/nuclease subunit A